MNSYYVEVVVKASVRVEAGSTTEAEIIAKDRLRQHTHKASTVLEVMSGNIEIGGVWCPVCGSEANWNKAYGTVEDFPQHQCSCPKCEWSGNRPARRRLIEQSAA